MFNEFNIADSANFDLAKIKDADRSLPDDGVISTHVSLGANGQRQILLANIG